MAKEIWDGYYPDGTLAGVDLVRGEPIPEQLRHLVAEILVRHEDGTFLLMQRDPQKENFGGFWEATAGGSALKGETALACAHRELKEETGIHSGALTEIGRFVSHNTIYAQYLCVTDQDKDTVTLQPGETAAFRWLDAEEFCRFVRSAQMIPIQRERYRPWLEAMGFLP